MPAHLPSCRYSSVLNQYSVFAVLSPCGYCRVVITFPFSKTFLFSFELMVASLSVCGSHFLCAQSFLLSGFEASCAPCPQGLMKKLPISCPGPSTPVAAAAETELHLGSGTQPLSLIFPFAPVLPSCISLLDTEAPGAHLPDVEGISSWF